MKPQKTAQKPVRGFAQNEAACKALEAYGIARRDIYEKKLGEHWDKIRLKRGERLAIVDGYRAFGGKTEILKAEAFFHKQEATIVDIETGHDSRTHSAAMLEAATGPRRLSPEYRRKMADERAAKRRESAAGMSNHEIEIEWKKPGIMSASERAAYLGIPRASLYAAYGKSGASAGRRPKHLMET